MFEETCILSQVKRLKFVLNLCLDLSRWCGESNVTDNESEHGVSTRLGISLIWSKQDVRDKWGKLLALLKLHTARTPVNPNFVRCKKSRLNVYNGHL